MCLLSYSINIFSNHDQLTDFDEELFCQLNI